MVGVPKTQKYPKNLFSPPKNSFSYSNHPTKNPKKPFDLTCPLSNGVETTTERPPSLAQLSHYWDLPKIPRNHELAIASRKP